MRDFLAEMIGQLEAGRPSAPEAVSILVVAPAGIVVDRELAGLAGPAIAARLYPGRHFGGVLHLEPALEPGSWYVAVECVGVPLSAVIGRRPAAIKSEV